MDILRFINSTAIRAHLEKIDYRFSASEAAWLVYNCKNVNLYEKHAAWQEIIDTMPDELLPRRRREERTGLHEFLREYMSLEKRWLTEFDNDNNAVYQFTLRNREDGSEVFPDPDKNNVFTDLKKCRSAIDEFLFEEDCDCDEYTVCITKYLPDSSLPVYDLTVLSTTDELMSISLRRYEDKRIADIRNTFCDLWVAFPTPFQKGDIVYVPDNIFSLWSGPFVLTDTASDYYNHTGKRMSGSWDMVAWGMFQRDNGTIYSECMHDYMNLEYYPEERLTGERRVLKAVRSFMKDEIDAEQLEREYRAILTEEYAKGFVMNDVMQAKGFGLQGVKE